MKRIVAVTGGIGAGKSVVCHALTALGFPVYDTDLAARRLMDGSADIKRRIAEAVSPDAIGADGSINRPALAAVVFADKAKLQQLNLIVHGAVREDFVCWADSLKNNLLFVETAILYESGFDALVGEIWEVTAPVDVRIRRVMSRSGLSESQVRERIAAQSSAPRAGHRIIENDDVTPLIPQILTLLS
ncbi:MAG: dephospho-CoA kinase [Muribaculaceae bacterium]|nr:dephospho-CoA kinase [Muribaculaceae bacterium]